MNRVFPNFQSPPEARTEPQVLRGGMNRLERLGRENGRVWPSYVGVGLSWLLAVAGLFATVFLAGYVFALGFKAGLGV